MAFPAEPMLASNLWLAETEQIEKDMPKDPRKLCTGEKGIDNALEGGFDYGLIHCITSDPDQPGAKELVQALLVSHLRSSANARATLIDSTISFDVRGLFKCLQTTGGNTEDGKAQAIKALDRLKIMKVFDYVGLTEAVAEVQEDIETKPPEPSQPAKKVPKSTIEDSEDEDEMLDSPPRPKNDPTQEQPLQPKGLLIIDNISQIMLPPIKNNYTQGQALLSTFMRSLGHLTKTQNLCTVLLSHSSSRPAAEDETLSMFKSCSIRPALGVGLGYLVDVHMFLHSLPTKKVGDGGKQGGGVEMANVLEIVQDRRRGRYGRWAAFICGSEGQLESVT